MTAGKTCIIADSRSSTFGFSGQDLVVSIRDSLVFSARPRSNPCKLCAQNDMQGALGCCLSDLPRHPSAAKVRNLIRIQKRRNDIQEMAYRLTLVETS